MKAIEDQKLVEGLKKIKMVEDYINGIIKERSELIYGMIIATISQDGCIVLGKPGTAKTLAGKLWANAIDPNEIFMCTGMPGNPPEMLYGPVHIKEYTDHGVFYRNTTNMMPDKKFVLWDEVDKDSDTNRVGAYSILHPEERVYFNGSKGMQPVKAQFVYLTMNQYDRRDILEPFFDRVALKYEVEYIKDNNVKTQYLSDAWTKATRQTLNLSPIGWDLLEQLNSLIGHVTVSKEAMKSFEKLYDMIRKDKVAVSDRRFSWVPRLAKACAIYDGRMEVEDTDLLIAKHILWDNLEDRMTVADCVAKCVSDALAEAKRIYSNAMSQITAIEEEMDVLKASDGYTPTKIQAKVFEINNSGNNAIKLLTEKRDDFRKKRKSTTEIDRWISEITTKKETIVKNAFGLS